MGRSANIAVIQLYNAGKQVFFVSLTHSGTNSIQQVPRGVITDPQCAALAEQRKSLFVRCAQIDRPEPERQRQMGMVHNRPCGKEVWCRQERH